MQYSDTEIETYLRSGEKEPELRREFGDALYEDLSQLANAIGRQPPALERARRKVFILPGIMGSRLSVVSNGLQDLIWIDPFDILGGGLRKLWPATADTVIAATGTVFAPYLRMRLRLTLAGYDASFLPYDWRLSPADTGNALLGQMQARGYSDVVLLGHSMGGLVARAMAAGDPGGSVVSQVITFGTPNHGSYAPLEILALSHGTLRAIAGVDLGNTARDIASDVLRHMPGLLEMLPDHAKRPDADYFAPATWPSGTVRPLKAALTAARAGAGGLQRPDDRFTQIVGWSEDTVVGARRGADGFVFEMKRDGDGTVPRDLAETDGITRYYTRGTHGSLCNRGDVIAATIDLIGTGQTAHLPQTRPLVTTESLAGVEISAESLAAQRFGDVPQPPVRETDFAGSFLSSDWAPDDDAPPRTAVIGTAPATGPSYNYPVSVIKAARTRWDGSKEERDNVVAKMASAKPLETESAPRLKAYTERLLTQVKASQRSPDPGIVADLETAVRTTGQVSSQSDALPAAERAFLERIIGEAEEFLSVMFVKRAVVAAASVGRIVTRDTHRGFGTGFLIAPGILMTNQHVLRSAQEARAASVQFMFELEVDSREAPGHVFELEPDRLFYASADLDMAIVAVAPVALDGALLSDCGQLPLIGAEGKIRKGQPVNIVQHPLGGRKQVVFRESLLSALPQDDDHVAHYTGDTQPGSSGSPVFSDRWEVIALHHSGVPAVNGNGQIVTLDETVWNEETDPDGRTIKWVANEGIRISRIIRHLTALPAQLEARGEPGADLVRDILRISEEANNNGAFIHKPPKTCPDCEARRNGARPSIPVRAPEGARLSPLDVNGTTVIPLQLTIGIALAPTVDRPV